ncbi:MULTISPECIES: filamentous hemagglutinin N-terminal domain-containing protein [unclassified Caballeronia]|uniref:filamentous hemagglutinin N-terminal domain-containing protein n=1 Tax=unclassified Caballeronia TaxID=2646786 RepID=UPI00285A8627|nr:MULTISPECIES: filamentous hemagglutinin N-terminal domain-containing protein [unclassified Caballeronia]MDR5755034.1 filamentous hemagglutinin N-terminal domain-containing protein [Caballeronia sp. LZ024]MDR5845126.1 filamentous hemagglutinin N-terminal domain-containing protein [Caballeronia sp. LZ031]
MKLRPLAAIVLASLTVPTFGAGPLPSGGKFVGGAGSMVTNGTTLAIKQTTPTAVIDWNSFSIGKAHAVSIDNPNGATLNRVTGPGIATIDGKLAGVGDVYLLDPHGVVVGRTGVVTTGGRFVASTLNITNDDFMRYFPQVSLTGKSDGKIVNLGKIESTGSDVFLIASNKVVNAGELRADKGLAQLAVGENVLIPLYERLGYAAYIQVGSGGTALNAGVIRAAQIAIEAADGNVFALAGHNRELHATGTAKRDGHVWLVAETGRVQANGATINAQKGAGPPSEIIIRADHLSMGDATVHADSLSITIPDLTIDSALARTFSHSLSSGTAVSVDTVYPSARTGDIVVGGDVRWTGAAPLYFRARHSVTISPGVTVANAGSGTFTAAADDLAANNGGSVLNYGVIEWCRSTGLVEMYYDRNGAYVPGVQRTNPAWRPAHLSGLKTQITGYMQINDSADFSAIYDNLAGNYRVNPSASKLNNGTTLPSPIGSAEHPFTGQFDGGGSVFSVSVDARNTNSSSTTGMFGVVGEGAVIRSFGLANGSVTASEGALGMIAGRNDGLIIDVDTYGTVRGGTTATGGVVGINRGVMAKTRNDFTTVSGGAATGGAVGVNEGIVIRAASGGGLAGVTSEHGPAGGVAGENRGHIEQSYYGYQLEAPTVSAGGAVGGLIGSNSGSISQSVTNARTSTTLSGAPLGGVAGVNVGQIAPDVFWGNEVGNATSGVGQGTMLPATSGLTNAGLGKSASYGPTWDFSSNGAWEPPEQYGFPQLRY